MKFFPSWSPFVSATVIIALIFLATSLSASAVERDGSDITTFSTSTGIALNWTLSLLLKILVGAIQLFETLVHYAVDPNAPVILELWKVIRDFCNMFFIFILIVMAFQTIFDIGSAKISGALITRFVIVAILINFSLTLSGLVISSVDQVNLVFLNGIGKMGDRIGQALDTSQLIGTAQEETFKSQLAIAGKLGCYIGSIGTGNTALALNCESQAQQIRELPLYSWNETFRLFFTVLLLLLPVSGIVVGVLFMIYRIPFLWFLLIMSPIAVFLSILPATRTGWEKWKGEFLGWNLFLPVYLFMMNFGMYILSQQNRMITGLRGWPAESYTNPLPGIGYSFQFIFLYVFIGIIFWVGMGMAVSVSRTTGRAAAGVKWSQGVASWLGRAPGRAVMASPVGSYYEGAKLGVESKYKQVRQEGIGERGWFGQQNRDMRRAGVSEFFGVKGAVEEQKRLKVKYFEDKYKKDNLDIKDLRTKLTSATGEERLAIYKRLKDLKDLGGDEMLDAYKLYQSDIGGNSATDFVKDIDFKKDLEKNERLVWFNDAKVSKDVKKKLSNVMAEEGEIKGKKELLQALRLFPQGNDRRDFLLSKVAKKKLVDAYQMAESLKIKDARGNAVDTNAYLENEIARRQGEDLLGLIDGGFYDADTDTLKDPKLPFDPKNPKTLTDQQKILMNKMIDVLIKKPKIVQNLLKNPKASPEQQMVVTFLGDAAQDRATKRAGGTPPPARAPHPDPF